MAAHVPTFPPEAPEAHAIVSRETPSTTIQYTTAGQFLISIGMSGMNGAIYDVITENNRAQIVASTILDTVNDFMATSVAFVAGDWASATRRAYFDQNGVQVSQFSS